MAKVSTQWEELLRSEIDNAADIFLSRSQFENVIEKLLAHSDCPLAGLQYEVECRPPFTSLSIGRSASGISDSRNFAVNDNRGTTCRVQYWLKDLTASKPAHLDSLLERCFLGYWKANLRTESAGLPDLKREHDAVLAAQKTIEYYADTNRYCALLFCDLDNFGEVNKTFGQKEGDRLIKEFGAILEAVSISDSFVLHNGGDEFIIFLLDNGSPERALTLAYNINKAIKKYDFKVSSIELGVSIGIASTEVSSYSGSFEKMSEKANYALTEFAKKPIKGLTRFHCDLSSFAERSEVSFYNNAAMCIIKSDIFCESPFSSVWLNCLSSIITELVLKDSVAIEGIEAAFREFVQWAAVETVSLIEGRAWMSRKDRLDVFPRIASSDWLFAIAHGILRATILLSPASHMALRMMLKYDEEKKECALHISDGHAISLSEKTTARSMEFDIGSSWTRESIDVNEDSARAILIQIGHENPGLPRSVFSDRIVVDDRPTRGGGLPDFWEATIARLIAHLVRNPNIAAVYVTGNQAFALQTVQKLRESSSWSRYADQIAYKTGLSEQFIRTAENAIRGKVNLLSTEEELIAHLSTVLRPAHIVKKALNVEILRKGPRFLNRVLLLDKMALGKEDGCRVKTVAEAFPIVLEIARQEWREGLVKDQEGSDLRELIDFKVHLTNPRESQIPSFYENEEDSLDNYFKKEFLGSEGLFGSKFTATGQLDAVLKHVISAIKDPNRQFATRRAILVIPHEIKDEDLSPLGLISVRIIPRFTQGRIYLSYSYTWRTVEALVGFPYSLYGSVKYSQHLTEEIRQRVPGNVARKVELGEVSYIAHSLHIFMDDFGQNIARRIIEDASL